MLVFELSQQVDLYREINNKILQMQTKAKWLGNYLDVLGDLREHLMQRVEEGVKALCDEIVPEERLVGLVHTRGACQHESTSLPCHAISSHVVSCCVVYGCSDPGLGLAFAAFLEVRVPINSVCKHALSRVMTRVVNFFLKIVQPVIDKFTKNINLLAKLITHVPHKDEVLDWSKPARKIVERLLNCPEIQIKKAKNGADVEWSCPGGQKPAHNMKHVHDGVTTSSLSIALYTRRP